MLLLLACDNEPGSTTKSPGDSTDDGCAPTPATVVTDIEGTLTPHADDWDTVFAGGDDPLPRPDAAGLFGDWAAAGYTVFYLSAFGSELVFPDGRDAPDAFGGWLDTHGFPRSEGDLVLAEGFGAAEDDVDTWKAVQLSQWVAAGHTLDAAYGNDPQDAAAYTGIGDVWIIGDTLAEADTFTNHRGAVEIGALCE